MDSEDYTGDKLLSADEKGDTREKAEEKHADGCGDYAGNPHLEGSTSQENVTTNEVGNKEVKASTNEEKIDFTETEEGWSDDGLGDDASNKLHTANTRHNEKEIQYGVSNNIVAPNSTTLAAMKENRLDHAFEDSQKENLVGRGVLANVQSWDKGGIEASVESNQKAQPDEWDDGDSFADALEAKLRGACPANNGTDEWDGDCFGDDIDTKFGMHHSSSLKDEDRDEEDLDWGDDEGEAKKPIVTLEPLRLGHRSHHSSGSCRSASSSDMDEFEGDVEGKLKCALKSIPDESSESEEDWGADAFSDEAAKKLTALTDVAEEELHSPRVGDVREILGSVSTPKRVQTVRRDLARLNHILQHKIPLHRSSLTDSITQLRMSVYLMELEQAAPHRSRRISGTSIPKFNIVTVCA